MIINIETKKWGKIKLTREQEIGLVKRIKLGYIITRSWKTKYAKWVRVDMLNIRNGATKALYWHNGWQIAH